jgi:hypothetical protein
MDLHFTSVPVNETCRWLEQSSVLYLAGHDAVYSGR